MSGGFAVEQKSFYYDLVIDETGEFLQNNQSYVVGFLTESEKEFLLSERYGEAKNQRVRVVQNNILLKDGFRKWFQFAQSKLNAKCTGFSKISDFDHLGATSYHERLPLQIELFNLYKDILDKATSQSWQVCVFKQPRSVLNRPVENGEAAAINYLETLANGLVALVLEKRFAKCTEDISFNVGIASRTYLQYERNDSGVESIKPAIEINEYRKIFNTCLVNKLGEKVAHRLSKKVNFYTINSMHDDNLAKKNNVYQEYDKDNNFDAVNVTKQFMLTIADCFANSYFHLNDFVDCFKNLETKLFEYDADKEFDFKKYWEIENDIFTNKPLNVINKLILFPSLGRDVENYASAYAMLQKRYVELLNRILIPYVLDMETHAREALFKEIKEKIKEQIKGVQLSEAEKLLLKLEELRSLYERMTTDNTKVATDIQKFGSDLYLFLANRYQNKGNSIGANEMCERAYALRDSWEDEQVLVYGLLTMNGLNDKYQFNEVYDKYYDRLKQLKRNSFSTFLGEHRESREIIELRGKLNSIFIESRIANGSADWAESRKAYKTGVECFDNWPDRQYIMFHFVRAALAANSLRIAKREFLSSLKEEYSRDQKKGNFSIIEFLTKNYTPLDEKDFYDANTGRFRAFVYLNYLTLVRELFNKNDNEAESLVRMFFHTDRILASLNAMEAYIYPSCVIYWRIAQIYRCKFEQSYANDSLEKSFEYYQKAIRVLEEGIDTQSIDGDEPRLLVILIAVVADYLNFLGVLKKDSDKPNILKQYEAMMNRLKTLYHNYHKYCRVAEHHQKDIFAPYFIVDKTGIVNLKAEANVLERIMKASIDYY